MSNKNIKLLFTFLRGYKRRVIIKTKKTSVDNIVVFVYERSK